MGHIKKILVPTDFSPHSDSAITYACDLAAGDEHSKTQVHLVHVIGDAPGSEGHTEKIRSRLEKLGRSLDEKAELAVETVKEVISGEPSDVITRYARDEAIDMIVMGTHGRTGLSHFALGSVAERVIRHSSCPVLVMGPRDAERKVTYERAAEEISKQLGDSFEASRDDGVEKIRKLLLDSFHLHSVTCMRLVDHLLEKEWIQWEEGEPGTWRVMEGIEFVEVSAVAATDPPVSQAVDLIQRARRLRATDVHLDPWSDSEILVRLRIDGKLEEYCRLNEAVGEALGNQLKTAADLDIANPFLPQEGRIRLPGALANLDVRITTAQVAAGEAIALRLFDAKNLRLPLGSLGLSQSSLQSVEAMLRQGEGLVLVTGPTGSGKTTTVYSMLATLGGIDRNIVSVEDPVEFAVPFVRQVNVDHKHGITMTTGLRTILRMDPDVVFLGEIRDPEAALIAMKAATSGKYVLSTLHTRNVVSTIATLRDLQVTDRSSAGNLTGMVNQRLVRRLCSECKRATSVTDHQREKFAAAEVEIPEQVFTPSGCEACRKTGFRGRVGIFEVALMDHALAEAVARGDSEAELKQLLRSRGVTSLAQDAMTKAADGITSVEEALSVHWLA